MLGFARINVAKTSNSTISVLESSSREKQISFNVDGLFGTIGFCNVTISKELLDGEFQVLVDDAPVLSILTQNATYVQE